MSSPAHSTASGADGAPDRAVAVGQPAADDPRRDHGGGEGCEHRRAVTHRALVEVQDDERGHRGVADDREREPEARAQRLVREQRALVVEAGTGLEALRDPHRHQRPGERRGRGERPDRLEAARLQDQLADRRPERQPAPDREPVEADDAPAAVGRREVDDPGRAGRVHGPLAGAQEKPRDDQAGNSRRDEQQQSGDRGRQRAEDHHAAPAAAVGEVAGERDGRRAR